MMSNCILSLNFLTAGKREMKSSNVHVANEFKFDTFTLATYSME